jgi:RecB family endonuclease NucS
VDSETDALGLGRLQRVEDVRAVWSHEASDFTPWLAANIDVLSDAIGLPLTVVGQEVRIGEFRLDIHATDPDGKTVIIENQLAGSDHLHLGQLLVYASGSKPRPQCGSPPVCATSTAAR